MVFFQTLLIIWYIAVCKEKRRGYTFNLTVICPTEPLNLNLQKFTSDDISKLIVQGYKDATDKLRT
jgi:NTE family protein